MTTLRLEMEREASKKELQQQVEIVTSPADTFKILHCANSTFKSIGCFSATYLTNRCQQGNNIKKIQEMYDLTLPHVMIRS